MSAAYVSACECAVVHLKKGWLLEEVQIGEWDPVVQVIITIEKSREEEE